MAAAILPEPSLDDAPFEKWMHCGQWAARREARNPETNAMGDAPIDFTNLGELLSNTWAAYRGPVRDRMVLLMDTYLETRVEADSLKAGIESIKADLSHPIHDSADLLAQRNALEPFMRQANQAHFQWSETLGAIRKLRDAIWWQASALAVVKLQKPATCLGYGRDIRYFEMVLRDLVATINIAGAALEDIYGRPGHNPFKILAMDFNPLPPPRGVPEGAALMVDPTTARQLGKAQPIAKKEGNPFIGQGANRWAPVLRKGVLGQGGQGVAAVWGRFDDNWTLQERVVRKDEMKHPSEWLQPRHFHVDENGAFIPQEYRLQAKCSRQEGAQNIVEALWGESDMSKGIVRLYTAFCQNRDLDNVSDWSNFQERELEEQFPVSPEKWESPLPEPFLWYVFTCLVEAGLIMQRGYVKDPPAVQNKEDWPWKSMIHMDLKPGNVFLDAPSKRFPDYPTPKFGDFGQTFELSEDDPLNPSAYVGTGGTPGYFPPESLPFKDRRTGVPVDRFPLGAHTNVWQVGAIMLGLMAGNREFEIRQQPSFLPTDTKGPRQLQYTLAQFGRDGIYSPQLCNMVEECLRFVPDERPSFQMLHFSLTSLIMNESSGEKLATRGLNSRKGGAAFAQRAWNGGDSNSDQAKEDWKLEASLRFKLECDAEYVIGFARGPPSKPMVPVGMPIMGLRLG